MSPADLHAFWRRTTETLQQTPLRATRTDAATQSGRAYVTSLVQMDSFEGKRLRAWYTVPKDPVPGCRFPAVLVVPGYGGEKPIPTHLAISGFAVLTLYPRGQGESCQEWTLEHKYLDRNSCMVFLGAQATRLLRKRPGWPRSQDTSSTSTTT